MKSNTNAQAQSILHLWNNSIRTAVEIQRRTNIAKFTIYYNLDKLRKTGSTAPRSSQKNHFAKFNNC